MSTKRAFWVTLALNVPSAAARIWSTRPYVIAVMFGWWMVEAIFGVEMQEAQSSVGKTLDSRIIFPPTLASFSTSRTR
jgi:hypothetical protein